MNSSEVYNNIVREFCGCYPDEAGNRPCDNGILCDKCMTEEIQNLYLAALKGEKKIMIHERNIRDMMQELIGARLIRLNEMGFVVELPDGNTRSFNLWDHAPADAPKSSAGRDGSPRPEF